MTARTRLMVFLVCLAVVAGIVRAATARPEAQAAAGSTAQLKQLAYLKASNTEGSDHFACGGSLPGHMGNALAISGDGNTVAVGAPHESSAAHGINGNQDDNSLYNSGAVYVFVRSGNNWTQQAYIKASNPGQSDLFGISLALSRDGNTLAVSAPWEGSAATGVNGNQQDNSIPQAGAVYVFTRTGGAWSQHSYLKASNTGRKVGDDIEGDQFGISLALSADGNTLAAGAIAEDSKATGINGDQADDSSVASGAVSVFTKAGSTWAQHAYVKSENSEGGDLFGYAVALSGDGSALAVAAYDEDGGGRSVNPVSNNGTRGSGAIYAFDRRGGTWSQSGYFKGSRSQVNDALGYSVAISDDGSTIAGSSGDDGCVNGGINPSGCDVDTPPEGLASGSVGAVYIWVRSGATWVEQAFIKASHPDLQDVFGVRLALNGDGNRLLVGAPMEDSAANGVNARQDDDDSAIEAGAAYSFTRVGTTWSQHSYIKASNAEEYDEFGSSVAMSGDGKTLVVGARMENSAAKGVNGNQNDNEAGQSGAAYIFGQ